jgi:concentrative nucleoside transporter, CNT family
VTATGVSSSRRARLVALLAAAVLTALVYALGDRLPTGIRAFCGILAFLALITSCSTNVGAINWRTVVWGLALQFGLALFILRFHVGAARPGYAAFAALAGGVQRFLTFTDAGAQFVFGGLADQTAMSKVFSGGFVFAFMGLPVIIFVSSFFTVLYHLGIVQVVVRFMAVIMMRLMRTSGAETLSAAANVFMGFTEAPLSIKPYVPRMTESELLTIMVGGLATVSGGMMAVYLALGADPVALLTTSVMAAPCGLYLSKILIPETAQPETHGRATMSRERTHANVIDAAAAGASDGMMLALNVAAMLIAFLSILALVDYLLGLMHAGLSLAAIFARVFAPAAALMGVPSADVPAVADLLGTKLVANDFVAYVKLTSQYRPAISHQSYVLSTYVLTGFANFGSIGILLGGIGGMAPHRRADMARLSGRALLGGFVATMINAAMAAMLM